MKPVCVPCRRFFRVKQNGFYFLEGMGKPGGNGRPPPGLEAPDQWVPYKLWVGDLWECQGCGAQILSGFGQNRIAEHYEDGFDAQVKRLGADQLQVNDC